MPAKKAAAKRNPRVTRRKKTRRKVAPQIKKLVLDEETLKKIGQIGFSQADSTKAAGLLGVTVEEFERFLSDNPEAASAYEVGFNKGRAKLHMKQFEAAQEGDQRAIKDVLKNSKPRRKPGPKPAETGRFTAKQMAAIEHYVSNGGVAMAAYRLAYPGSEKWKKPALAVAASRLFCMPHVAAKVAELQKKVARIAEKKFLVTQERILEELARIGFANMQDYVAVGEDGRPTFDIATIPRDQFAAVGEITVEETNKGMRTKLKLHDKLAALVHLGKHVGLWKETPANINVLNLTVSDARESIQRKLARLAEQKNGAPMIEHMIDVPALADGVIDGEVVVLPDEQEDKS